MKKGKIGLAPVVAVLALLFVIVAIVAISSFPEQKSSVEVQCSLDPSTIRENGHTTLIVTFKNADLKTHKITIAFSQRSHIRIHKGNEAPLQDNKYAFVLEATDPSAKKAFGISGNLDADILSAQFQVSFDVAVDGKMLRKDWADPVLTINRS